SRAANFARRLVHVGAAGQRFPHLAGKGELGTALGVAAARQEYLVETHLEVAGGPAGHAPTIAHHHDVVARNGSYWIGDLIDWNLAEHVRKRGFGFVDADPAAVAAI